MRKSFFISVIVALSIFIVSSNSSGDNQWISIGPWGANVLALAINPQTPDTLYAGTNAGVFKSTNGGTDWTATGLTYTDVNALAINPQTPDTLYAGTNAGVFKSTNGGPDWTATGLTYTDVNALAINPQTPDTLYAGTNAGVFKSTNGGTDWTATGLTYTDVNALAINPQTPDTLYAGTNAGVFKSTNGGPDWTATGLTYTDVNALAINPQTPDTLYAGTRYGGVFKSTNGGANWTATGLTYTDVNALAINPQTPDTLYAGTDGDGVFKSTNGGTNWTAMNTDLTNTNVLALAINPQTPDTLYAGTNAGVFKSTNGATNWTAMNTGITNTNVLALAINPQTPDTLYAGTDGDGVFKSTNGGTNWTAMNTGITNTDVLALAINPQTPDTLYAGTSGTIGGVVLESTDGGRNWTRMNTGFVFDYVLALTINPETPDTLYVGTYYGGVFRNTNGTTNWIATGLTSTDVLALAINPQTPDTLYAGTYYGGVFRSTNGGTNWTAMNTGLTSTNVLALAINPQTPDTLYAGTYYGGVFKSTNGGTNWTAMNTGLANTYAHALAINPQTPDTLYAGTLFGGVFKIQQVTEYILTVLKSGTGSGTVTSSPAGINCGSDCSESYNPGTIVTLTATQDAGSTFAGWSGACSGTGQCSVTMNADQTVTATFNSEQYTLTVNKSGTGNGTVTSSPAGINCGSDCSESYNPGTIVTLTATQDAGSTFAGWSGGGCSGTGSCSITINNDQTITATFNQQPQYSLTVIKSGTGSGTVTSSPAGINCGSGCSESYDPGTIVTLTATQDAGSSFGGWSGDLSGTANAASLTMNGPKTVVVNFTQNQYTLTININPTGSGSPTKNPDKATYVYGEQVQLTATANQGYTFNNWSDDASGSANPISITMNGNKTVTAHFTELIGPDLTGEWTTPVIQTCKSTKKGQKCTITGTLTINNNGNRDASSSTVKFYLSDNNTYDQGDTPLSSANTGKIKAKNSKSIKLSKSFPVGQIVTDKYIIAVIDKYNSVKEIDETNNIIVFGPIQ